MKTTEKIKTCETCGTMLQAETCSVCSGVFQSNYEPASLLRATYKTRETFFREPEPKELFTVKKNSAIESAKAALAYSLVPFIGIIFIPITFICAIFGISKAYRKANSDDKNMAVYTILASVLVSSVQCLLWYLLYLIPELKNLP